MDKFFKGSKELYLEKGKTIQNQYTITNVCISVYKIENNREVHIKSINKYLASDKDLASVVNNCNFAQTGSSIQEVDAKIPERLGGYYKVVLKMYTS